MSINAISEYLSGENLTDAWKVYYNFTSYNGDYVANSVPSSTAFSGYIRGNATSFKDTVPGSAYFNNNSLEIVSGAELLEGNGVFTMLISQEKIDNSCGTLFGNYKGDKIPTSGWEFAINNANKLYFKNFERWSPTLSTLNNIPSHKNFYYISSNGAGVEYARYLADDEGWEHGGITLNPNY